MNPRAAINYLHPLQGCPFDLLGTSPNEVESSTLYLITEGACSNGEGGIRTHAPFRTNGFQDRLVMTASIPLQTFRRLPDAKHILTKKTYGVNNFFHKFFEYFTARFLWDSL